MNEKIKKYINKEIFLKHNNNDKFAVIHCDTTSRSKNKEAVSCTIVLSNGKIYAEHILKTKVSINSAASNFHKINNETSEKYGLNPKIIYETILFLENKNIKCYAYTDWFSNALYNSFNNFLGNKIYLPEILESKSYAEYHCSCKLPWAPGALKNKIKENYSIYSNSNRLVCTDTAYKILSAINYANKLKINNN